MQSLSIMESTDENGTHTKWLNNFIRVFYEKVRCNASFKFFSIQLKMSYEAQKEENKNKALLT